MIQLVPMTPTEFDKFLATEVEDYAQEHVKAGNWPADTAVELSRDEFAQLLPNGPTSPNQYLYSIQEIETQAIVGLIWFADQKQGQTRRAFIYDIRIYETEQGKGYGKEAMLAIEDKVKALGIETITLHVFGHNHIARALYEKIGYNIADLIMSKKLSHDPA
jgi:RimJ/RimL family protein N-acetyltransferase